MSQTGITSGERPPMATDTVRADTMQTVRIFTVVPELPERLEGLRTLAYNLWWTWNPEAIELFQRLDRQLWEQCYHNPVLMLGRLDQQNLDSLEKDEAFTGHLDSVMEKLQEHLTANSWYQHLEKQAGLEKLQIAYFSAEFGLTEVLPLYSGGLGLLSGDHLNGRGWRIHEGTCEDHCGHGSRFHSHDQGLRERL